MKNRVMSYLGIGAVLTWLQLHDHSTYMVLEPYWKDYKDWGFLSCIALTILMVLAWPVVLAFVLVDMTKWFLIIVWNILKFWAR